MDEKEDQEAAGARSEQAIVKPLLPRISTGKSRLRVPREVAAGHGIDHAGTECECAE